MLRIAFASLSLAVLLGAVLAILHLRPDARRPHWIGRAAHGLLGVAGLVLLLGLAWQAAGTVFPGPRGSLARSGLALIAAAMPLGLILWLGWRRLAPARSAVLILHAVLAITGYVLLSGWYLGG